MSYLGLLGMSGAGKSYWSKKLADGGWQWIDWDDLIYKRLGKELNCTFADKYEPGKWAGQFSQNQGETLEAAYAHSYPRLIETRMTLCEKYAHKTLPYEWHSSLDCTIKAFLKEIGLS